jgi:predicted NUDIX family phosphoesterase
MSEQVLVFKRDSFLDLPTYGFFYDPDLLPRILENVEFIDRPRAEADPTYKQIIPYSILRYRESVFRYKRSAWGSEARLHGLYSIGIGGHVNELDTQTRFSDNGNSDLPLHRRMMPVVEWTRDRELHEEFTVEKPGDPRLIGFLNDESNDVGRMHFGVVYEYRLNNTNVAPREKRIHIQSDFSPLGELIACEEEYENWSRIIIAQYLSYEMHAVGR